MSDDDDVAGADLNWVTGKKTKRYDFAPGDDAVAEVVNPLGVLLIRPPQNIGEVTHDQAHPFGSGHPAHSRTGDL